MPSIDGVTGPWSIETINDRASKGAFLVSAASYNMGKEMAKWAPMTDGWGNVVVKSSSLYYKPWVVGLGKGLRWGGGIVGGATTLYSGYQFVQDPTLLNGSNTAFGVVGFFGVPGMVASGLYFGGQAIMQTESFKAYSAENAKKYPITGQPPAYIGHCFVGKTKILMKDFSRRNIEDVKVGDTVKTYNISTGELENNKVQKISTPIHKDLITISFSNGIENSNTEDHPYYVKGKGWCSFKPELTYERYGIEALQLKHGDICYYYESGEILEIKVIEFIPLNEEVRTYNLTEIENSNNYFANGILVNTESKLKE